MLGFGPVDRTWEEQHVGGLYSVTKLLISSAPASGDIKLEIMGYFRNSQLCEKERL